ncbi:phage tail P2-like protein [Crenobacter luteus]|uniref:phage tail protein I n=1 Tax=Crenobacter luteus TaxID=1452487 RepID=UPI001050819F|nr:phage tail protein I [Crenobacter luteus]TCP13772.1 phage tail P2-like protein [Crenobacter luteus]
MSRQLLPPNRTPLEAALADAGAFSLDPTPLRWLADAGRCPVEFLPWLAWARSVEGFDAADTEEKQRALIRQAVDIHKRKGTVAAVRDIFRALGLGEVTIETGRAGYRRDGTRRRTAFNKRGTRAEGWAEYRVVCYSRLTVQQAAIARAMLADIAPARCHLFELDFRQAALTRNGLAKRDGSYTRGTT